MSGATDLKEEAEGDGGWSLKALARNVALLLFHPAISVKRMVFGKLLHQLEEPKAYRQVTLCVVAQEQP